MKTATHVKHAKGKPASSVKHLNTPAVKEPTAVKDQTDRRSKVMERARQLKNSGMVWNQAIAQAWKEIE